jgi:hypothetical protein
VDIIIHLLDLLSNLLPLGTRQKLKDSLSKVEELSDQLRLQENVNERMKRAETTALERVNDLQNHLNDESSQRISLENSVRDMEYRQKRFKEQLKEEYEGKISEYEVQITLLKDEVRMLTASKRDASKSGRDEQKSSKKESEEQRRGDVKKKQSGAGSYATTENDSFAVSERSHQSLLQKDDKIDHLTRQLQQAEVASPPLHLSFVSHIPLRVHVMHSWKK